MRVVIDWLAKVIWSQLCGVGEARWESMLLGWDSQRWWLEVVMGRLNLEVAASTVSSPSSPVHAAVPPVLDSVVASATESACDFGPTFAHLANHLLNHETFLWGNRIMV